MSKLTLADVLAAVEKIEARSNILDTDLTSDRYAAHIKMSRATAGRRLLKLNADNPGMFEVLKIKCVTVYRLTEAGRKLMEGK